MDKCCTSHKRWSDDFPLVALVSFLIGAAVFVLLYLGGVYVATNPSSPIEIYVSSLALGVIGGYLGIMLLPMVFFMRGSR